MQTFKQYVKEQEGPSSKEEKRQDSSLSWDKSSHGEFTDDDRKPDEKEVKTEEVIGHKTGSHYITDEDANMEVGGENKSGHKHHKIHDDPEIKPKKFTREQRSAACHFCNAKTKYDADSSGNMNAYLDRRNGSKHEFSYHMQGTIESNKKAHEDSIKKFSSCFSKENTNRKPITTYCGVPHHVGAQLESHKAGSSHQFPRFTSTSTKKNVALNFAEKHADNKDETHVIKCHVAPGAGLSLAHISKWNENEVALHHGAHVTYHGTTIHEHAGKIVHEHHVTVHARHTPLHEYPHEYHDGTSTGWTKV